MVHNPTTNSAFTDLWFNKGPFKVEKSANAVR